MSTVHSDKIYFLAGRRAIGFEKITDHFGKKRVEECSSGDQLKSKLDAELPAAVLIEEQKIENLSRYLEDTFTNKPGRRFLPVFILSNEPERIREAFRDSRAPDPAVVIAPDDQEGLLGRLTEATIPSVNVKFWGVRGSTPCPNSENIIYGGNTSCVEIEVPGTDRLLILDSGTGIRNLGNFLEHYSKKTLSGDLFITHPHWDHIQGFPFFPPFYKSTNCFNIRMPEQYRGGTKEILSGHLTKTFFPVTLGMFDSKLEYITQEENLQQFGDTELTVDYIVANHPTKTAIYRFSIHGYTIVYAPDNELPMTTSPLRFVDRFCDFIKDCDLLIHDGQYDLEMLKKREGWGHSAWERVLELSRKSGVKRLYLTHHDPVSTDDKLDALSAKLTSYRKAPFTELKLAREGEVVRLPLKKAD